MNQKEQRITLAAILGSIIIRQLFEIVLIRYVPQYQEISLVVRLIVGILIAILSYIGMVRWLRYRAGGQ